MDKTVYLGLDIGKFQLSCSAPGASARDFPNTTAGLGDLLKFRAKVATPAQLFLVMESTGEYSRATAQALLELAPVRVAIVPPACVLGFTHSRIRRTKTDRADALAIRQYGAVLQPAPWLPPEAVRLQLGQLKLVLDGLTKTTARLKCLMEKLESARQPCVLALDAQQRLLDLALAERQRLEAEIETLVQSDVALARDSALILSIDGVGKTTRTMILALCFDALHRLPQRKLLAYCGMSPQEHQSGQFRGLTRMNKRGDSRIREMLYMVALRMIRQDGLMRDYFTRQKEQLKKPGKVILVSIMRKVLYLIQPVVKSGEPFNRDRYLQPA